MARTFDGTNDKIAFGASASEDLTTFTAFAWINFPSNFTAERQILAKTNVSYQAKQLLQTLGAGQNDFAVHLGRATTAMQSYSAANALTAGVWNAVLSTCDGTNAPKLYVATMGNDLAEVTYGTQIAGSGSFHDLSAVPLTVGSRDPNDTYWTGQIAEVGLWNRVLSAAEIQSLGRGYAPSFFPDGLVQYLPLSGQNSPEPRYGSGNATEGVVTEATKRDGPSIMKYPRGQAPRQLRPRPFAPGMAR